MPQYNITRLIFEERPDPGSDKQAMGAEVSITASNQYPVAVDVPAIGFEVFMAGCGHQDSQILVADAMTSPIAVRPKSDVVADVHGLVRD